MKKILAGIIAGVLLSTAAHAIVARNPLSATRLHRVTINVVYEKDALGVQTDTIKNIFVKGYSSVLDDQGAVVGSHSEAANWSQLPATPKNHAKELAKWVGKQINLAAVNENVEPNLP